MVRTWLFDVDGCLVDSLTGTSLRPGAAALLTRLGATGHRVHVWSAGGADYASDRLAQHGMAGLVLGCHAKRDRDADGRYVPPRLDSVNIVFVDDRPEDLPVGAEVIAVSPYLSPNPHDTAMVRLVVSAPTC